MGYPGNQAKGWIRRLKGQAESEGKLGWQTRDQSIKRSSRGTSKEQTSLGTDKALLLRHFLFQIRDLYGKELGVI